MPRGGHRGQSPRKAPALGSKAAATVGRAGRGGPLPGPGTRGRPESRVAFYAHRFGVPSLLVALVASGLQPAAFPPPKRAARAVATRGEALRRGPLETAGPPGRKPQSPPLGPVWATGEDAEGRRGDRQLARQGRQTADRGEQGEGLQDATASGPRGGGRPPATGVQRPEHRPPVCRDRNRGGRDDGNRLPCPDASHRERRPSAAGLEPRGRGHPGVGARPSQTHGAGSPSSPGRKMLGKTRAGES